MIKDFVDGDSLSSEVFLIKDVSKGVTANGLNYLNIQLQDSSGVIEAKKWSISNDDLKIFLAGNAVVITGDVYDYKGKLQLKVYKGEIASKDVDLKNLLLESPKPVDELIEKFKFYLNSIKDNDIKLILNEIFNKYYKDYINYPAAVRNHHEFYHGLIYHSVGMCELANTIVKLYNDVDYDLLIAGCLLHDIGKLVELSGPVSTKYTNEGNLLGHLTIGMSIVKEASNKLGITSEVPLLLEHMILSHHGKLEYGAAVLPATREALLLSMIDDLDAKMMILDKAYEGVEKGGYTERIFALDNRNFYKRK